MFHPVRRLGHCTTCAYTGCAKKVTPFWYLSFLPLLDALFAIFVYLHISDAEFFCVNRTRLNGQAITACSTEERIDLIRPLKVLRPAVFLVLSGGWRT